MNRLIKSVCIALCVVPLIAFASPNVILVASVSCPHCPAAAKELRDHGIKFTELYVETSSQARRLLDKGHVHFVPALFVDGQFKGGPDAVDDYVRGK